MNLIPCLLAFEEFLQFFALLQGGRLIGIDEIVQQPVYIAGVRRHATLQHVVGIGLVSQQLGYLAAQVDEPLADVQVVLAVIVGTDGIACHIHLAAQLPLGGVGHEG